MIKCFLIDIKKPPVIGIAAGSISIYVQRSNLIQIVIHLLTSSSFLLRSHLFSMTKTFLLKKALDAYMARITITVRLFL